MSSRAQRHLLTDSGRVWRGWPDFRYGGGPGSAWCSCGAKSPDLPTTAARKRWHRHHKNDVLADEYRHEAKS